MRFECASAEGQKPDEPCVVTLRQGQGFRGNVSILVNGVEIAWLDGVDGRLGIAELEGDDRKTLADQGMKFDSTGEIVTY